MRILFVGYAVIDLIDGKTFSGGAGGSMSLNAAKLGFGSSFFGPLSTDEQGLWYQQRLSAAGVDFSLCDLRAPALPLCEIVDKFGHGSTRRWEDRGAYEHFISMPLTARDLLPFDRIFLCNAPPEVGEHIAQSVDKRKLWYIPGPKSVTVPNWVRPNILQKSEIAFANEEEFPFLSALNPFACGVRMVAATRGSKGGAVLMPDGKKFFYRPVRNLSVIDTTGAGDAWALGFATEWMRVKNVRTAINTAKRLAAECIQTKGGLL